VRPLFEYQSGLPVGIESAPMAQVVKQLPGADMIFIASCPGALH
jgi:hypothetical protein